MSQNSAAVPTDTTRKLNISDPVEPETLAKFGELQAARLQAAERLLDLEQERIRTLRAASNIDNERQRLFEALLISRGLAPNAPVEIDAKTGRITQVDAMGAPVKAPPSATADSAQVS